MAIPSMDTNGTNKWSRALCEVQEKERREVTSVLESSNYQVHSSKNADGKVFIVERELSPLTTEKDTIQ